MSNWSMRMAAQAFMVISTFAVLAHADEVVSAAEAGRWKDTFFQYRVPLEIEVSRSGWNVIDVDEAKILDAVNSIEDLKYSPRGPQWFAYNYCTAVEVDPQGIEQPSDVKAGFYLIEEGPNLARNALSQPNDTVDIDVEPGQHYLLRYTASDADAGSNGLARHSPAYRYELIHAFDSPSRLTNYTSYEPPLLPRARTEHERLLIPKSNKLTFDVRGRFVSGIHDISLRRAAIRFAGNFGAAGRVRLMVYYQPMCAYYMMLPEKRLPRIPTSHARTIAVGEAERWDGDTRYSLSASDAAADVWFAETTVKITPQAAPPPPAMRRDRISISAAANEAQSFQFIVRPKMNGRLDKIEIAGDLSSGNASIPRSRIEISELAYVPIHRMSDVTPASALGPLGDPLVAPSARDVSAEQGNIAYWITVRVPPNTPPGDYQGKIRAEFDSGAIEVPLSLKVWNFQLPEYSPFHVSVGGLYFERPMDDSPQRTDRPGAHGLMGYHDVTGNDGLRKLVKAYFTAMARDKFYPCSVTMHTADVRYRWSPPPRGYNVDSPDNLFKLYDWDFTAFNQAMSYYVDELKVNTVRIYHTNPMRCNVFGLSGGTDGSISVAHSVEPNDPKVDHEITVAQYQHLLVDYFRAFAQNLKEHGWLDKSFIVIDETMHQQRLLTFLQTLKSDPLVAQIKVGACVQGYETMNHKLDERNKKFAFNGLLDFYIPQMDENYNRWEKYLFPDHDITPRRDKLWNYAVQTARLSIDVPGIDNRITALDLFNRGGSGFFVWDTIFWTTAFDGAGNPWEDPYTVWGNGTVASFYPPARKGLSDHPDFTITPSCRVLAFREGVDDYEYAWLLEQRIAQAKQRGVDVTDAQRALGRIARMFHNSVHWSQNDAYYLDTRQQMAQAIERLNEN